MIALLLVPLLLQTDGWSVTPERPTVGDTIRVERTIEAPAGWRVRAGKLDQYGEVEQLGEPSIVARQTGWTVRYLIVGWKAGSATITMPSLWRLGPDGSNDSLSGGTVTLRIASVIPDTVTAPQPQPSLGILRLGRASAIPVIVAVVFSVGLLFGLIAWRRRASRIHSGSTNWDATCWRGCSPALAFRCSSDVRSSAFPRWWVWRWDPSPATSAAKSTRSLDGSWTS